MIGRMLLAALSLLPFTTGAHPLGQNAFNREAAILVEPDHVQLTYLLDLAEVPSLAIGEQADVDRDGIISDTEWTSYAERWAQALPQSLRVEIDGKPLTLSLERQTWRVTPGQAGLSTLRLLAQLRAPMSTALGEQGATLDYRDQTQVNRLGWKEIWIGAAKGARIVTADVPQQDRSKALTDFTPRAEGPPALITAHAELGLAARGNADDDAASAAALTAADIRIDARAGAEKPLSTEQTSPLWSFFRLGVRHIAGGWDHLMFLLGLVLLSGNLRKLTITVTAFTVAHSLTLGLAAFGYVHPPGNWVEALIAVTIAYVGAAALRGQFTGRSNSHGPWLAFGFGLIHGFGFAGALSESLGSSNTLRLTGLLSFNLGIEAFQLSLVCVVVPLLRSLARRPVYGAIHSLLASLVFLAGAGWFLFRSFGDGVSTLLGFGLMVAALIAALVIAPRRRQEPDTPVISA